MTTVDDVEKFSLGHRMDKLKAFGSGVKVQIKYLLDLT